MVRIVPKHGATIKKYMFCVTEDLTYMFYQNYLCYFKAAGTERQHINTFKTMFSKCR